MIPNHRLLARTGARLWAAPNTLLGIVVGASIVCLGGRLRLVRGIAEFSGGRLARVAALLPPSMRFSAMTLGHVVVGLSEAHLAAARDHEHVHVRQYERWGPFFLPAYFASSLWQLLRRRRAYRDNFFERQAYGAEMEASIPSAQGYAEQAGNLIARYEAIPFEHKYDDDIVLLPHRPGWALDIGAATGVDAAWLATRGHRVVAVEPTRTFREAGARLHPSPSIEWLDDHLPDLRAVRALGRTFDIVLLTAVWMHLDASERTRAMPVVASLLASDGVLLMALRHGPVPAGRRMFEVSAAETIALAGEAGLRAVRSVRAESSQPENRAAGVTWSRIVLRR